MNPNITLREVLELAVATETLGGEYYRDLATEFGDRSVISGIFKQLAMDEDQHEIDFRRVLKSVEDRPLSENRDEHLRRAAALLNFFQTKFNDERGEIKSERDALLFAISFERSTLDFYRALKETLGNHAQIQGLINAEKEHLKTLMRVTVADSAFRGLRS